MICPAAGRLMPTGVSASIAGSIGLLRTLRQVLGAVAPVYSLRCSRDCRVAYHQLPRSIVHACSGLRSAAEGMARFRLPPGPCVRCSSLQRSACPFFVARLPP